MRSPRQGLPPTVGAEQRGAPLSHTGLGLSLSSRYLGAGRELPKAPQEGAVSAPPHPAGRGRGRPWLTITGRTVARHHCSWGNLPTDCPSDHFRGCGCLSSRPVSPGAAGEPLTATPAVLEVPLPSAFLSSLPGGDFRAALSGVVTADVRGLSRSPLGVV